MSVHRVPRLARWALAAAVLLGVAACISERPTAVAPPDLNAICRIAVGSPVFGSTQALIAIRNFSYLPDTIRVKAGTTVTWVNCEPPQVEPHTATADADVWSSEFMTSGAMYSRTFATAGRFAFYCVPHPTMRGTIVVE